MECSVTIRIKILFLSCGVADMVSFRACIFALKLTISTIYIIPFLLRSYDPAACHGLPPLSWGFLDHTRHTTVGRTLLDEWSARRRDLYLTTHNNHNKHPCPSGFRAHDLNRRAAAELRLIYIYVNVIWGNNICLFWEIIQEVLSFIWRVYHIENTEFWKLEENAGRTPFARCFFPTNICHVVRMVMTLEIRLGAFARTAQHRISSGDQYMWALFCLRCFSQKDPLVLEAGLPQH